jgi:hypothetical protein
MDEDPSEPSNPSEHQRSDAAARPGDLAQHAKAATDATFEDDEDAKQRMVPGLLSGDVGPKGRISAQLRDLSRTERSSYGEVPRGTMVPGGGRLLLGMMLGFAFALLVLALLIGWVASR